MSAQLAGPGTRRARTQSTTSLMRTAAVSAPVRPATCAIPRSTCQCPRARCASPWNNWSRSGV